MPPPYSYPLSSFLLPHVPFSFHFYDPHPCSCSYPHPYIYPHPYLCPYSHLAFYPFSPCLSPISWLYPHACSQAIIDEDRDVREKLAASKQLQLESEGLSGVEFSSFQVKGQSVTNDAYTMVLASFKDREYTVKASSKRKVVAMSLQSRVMNELVRDSA